MLSRETLNEISSRISDTIESSPLKDLERNVKAVASSVFDKMDLVSKDQLENNEILMRHLFENIDLLERRVDELLARQQALVAVIEAADLGDRNQEPLKSALRGLDGSAPEADA